MNPTKSNSESTYLQDFDRYNGKPGRFLKLYLYLENFKWAVILSDLRYIVSSMQRFHLSNIWK